MLENMTLQESSGEIFDWDSLTEYSRSKALRSAVMNSVLRELAESEIRTKFVLGGGLFGIVLRLPNFKESNQILTLNITLQREIELRRLDITGNTLKPIVIHRSIHSRDEIVNATTKMCSELALET